jgi:hypothetical protein
VETALADANDRPSYLREKGRLQRPGQPEDHLFPLQRSERLPLMARIRTVKPEFWQDEKMSKLDPMTRLVFLGLISMADDAGRLIDNIKFIDAFIFPETEHSAKDSLGILARLSRICRYTSESGQKLIQITNWDRHQRVDNPNKYVLPAPPPGACVQVVAPDQLELRVPPDTKADEPPKPKVSREPREDVALRPTTNDQRSTTNDHIPLRGGIEAEGQFEAIWSNRPRRSGSDPKEPARKAFMARLKAGVPLTALVEGAVRYKRYCAARGIEGTEYVMQMQSFYGPLKRGWEEPWDIPPPTPNGRQRGSQSGPDPFTSQREES